MFGNQIWCYVMSSASSWIEEFFSWLWWSCWSLILVEQSVNYFEVLITFWNILRNWNLWKILDPPLSHYTVSAPHPTPPPPPPFLSFNPKFWNGWIRKKSAQGTERVPKRFCKMKYGFQRSISNVDLGGTSFVTFWFC